MLKMQNKAKWMKATIKGNKWGWKQWVRKQQRMQAV